MELLKLRDLYRQTLLDDVIPFWIRHAIDTNGGINTCIADDGRIINRDRWLWSQWRAVWVFSKLYNSLERRPDWLEIARGIYKFITANGPLENGHWPLLLDADGRVQRGFDSLYVDGFAIYALAEYYRTTRDPDALSLALRTFEACEEICSGSQPPPAWPYPIPAGWSAHGLSMILSLAYFELSKLCERSDIETATGRHHKRVMNLFLRPDRGLVLEWMREDGSECPPPEGTAVCPGHAIESMWFQMHIARANRDERITVQAAQAIRVHLERGWDEEFGGLFLAIDAGGASEVGWPHASTKLWWPHTEALYATLLAYEITREDWCLEWHDRIHEYSYAQFPDREHGEWTQKLDREGNKIADALFLPVKDPFHLPRALYYCLEVLNRLIEEADL